MTTNLTQTVSLSARLRVLELEVSDLNELRTQRAELDRRIEVAEDSERLLASVEFLLTPLLDGEVPKVQQVIADPPAKEIAVLEIEEGSEGENAQPVDVQEPAPADPAGNQDVQEVAPSAAVPYQLSAPARVWEWVRGLPDGQEFTAQDCADATDMAVTTAKGHLGNIKEKGELRVVDGTGFTGVPSKYMRDNPAHSVAVAPAVSIPPSGTAEELSLTPIPPKLSTDECSLFDVLRRDPSGLSERRLGARLNWGGGRVIRTLQGLTGRGYVGRNGDEYRVIPDELRGDAAADA